MCQQEDSKSPSCASLRSAAMKDRTPDTEYPAERYASAIGSMITSDGLPCLTIFHIFPPLPTAARILFSLAPTCCETGVVHHVDTFNPSGKLFFLRIAPGCVAVLRPDVFICHVNDVPRLYFNALFSQCSFREIATPIAAQDGFYPIPPSPVRIASSPCMSNPAVFIFISLCHRRRSGN